VSSTGCGFPTPFAGESLTCGTRLYGLGDIAPVLCPACLVARASYEKALRTNDVAAGAICEGCHEAPATRDRPPFLCDVCEAEYAADLAQQDQCVWCHENKTQCVCRPRGQIHPDLCRMLAVAGAILTALLYVVR
jgi:hypothetical protein